MNKKLLLVENISKKRRGIMGKTPLKKVIKAKLKSNKELTPQEKIREKIKYEIAEELGLVDKVKELGWSSLTAEETGRIGGMMTRKKKQLNLPKNKDMI
jgi:small acid-soluble spore protein F (minor alpha/beta-type SASP)